MSAKERTNRLLNMSRGELVMHCQDVTMQRDELLAALELLAQWREVITKSDISAKSAILEDLDDASAAIAKVKEAH